MLSTLSYDALIIKGFVHVKKKTKRVKNKKVIAFVKYCTFDRFALFFYLLLLRREVKDVNRFLYGFENNNISKVYF